MPCLHPQPFRTFDYWDDFMTVMFPAEPRNARDMHTMMAASLKDAKHHAEVIADMKVAYKGTKQHFQEAQQLLTRMEVRDATDEVLLDALQKLKVFEGTMRAGSLDKLGKRIGDLVTKRATEVSIVADDFDTGGTVLELWLHILEHLLQCVRPMP